MAKSTKHEVVVSVEKKNDEPEHFWQPLMMRDPQERQQSATCKNRLIGLELRMRDPFGCQEELQMIPLNIELVNTGNASMPWSFGPLTLHTSVGDVNIPAVVIPPSGL